MYNSVHFRELLLEVTMKISISEARISAAGA